MAKILVVAPYRPHPARHGGAIRSRVLLDALRSGHEVHLAAAIATDEDRGNAVALGRELDIAVHALAARATPRGHILRKLGHWLRGLSELLARRWHHSARAQVEQLLRSHDFDLVVADSTFALPVLPRHLPRLMLFLHNLEHAMFARDEVGTRSLSDRITRRAEASRMAAVERSALGDADLAVTVSDHDRELALALWPDANVVAVANSVDLDRLPLLPPVLTRPPRLLFVGALDYPPNLHACEELVNEHLPVLRHTFPELSVRLVGKDTDGHGERFRGIDGVEVVGPVEDLVPQYADCNAVYLPIRSGGGTRIKVLEAWALGVPVLTTKVGSEGLPAVDGTHLRRFETPAQGVAALRDLLDGGPAKLRANGRRLVEQQSHKVAMARLRELTDELLQLSVE